MVSYQLCDSSFNLVAKKTDFVSCEQQWADIDMPVHLMPQI